MQSNRDFLYPVTVSSSTNRANQNKSPYFGHAIPLPSASGHILHATLPNSIHKTVMQGCRQLLGLLAKQSWMKRFASRHAWQATASWAVSSLVTRLVTDLSD